MSERVKDDILAKYAENRGGVFSRHDQMMASELIQLRGVRVLLLNAEDTATAMDGDSESFMSNAAWAAIKLLNESEAP